MSGKSLNWFDMLLCGHALCNLNMHLHEPDYRNALYTALGRGALREYYFPTREQPYEGGVWLTLEEFDMLADACEVSRTLNLKWWPNPYFHRQYKQTIQEVRDELAPQAAQEWAQMCSCFIRQLDQPGLLTAPAIRIIKEWVDELRSFLLAMGANLLLPQPQGRMPTPSRPLPLAEDVFPDIMAANTKEAARVRRALPKIRKALLSYPVGSNPKPIQVIGSAKVQPKIARKALRFLEGLGEYKGFRRTPASNP
jgi:hypothetical protein